MPRPARRPERDLRNAILQLLRAHGIAAWPTGIGAFKVADRFVRLGSRGMSDIVGCVPRPVLLTMGAVTDFPRGPDGRYVIGQLLAIEVKNPTGKVSPEQTAFLQTVVRAGGIGFVARSCDDVIDKLSLRRP